MRIHAFRYMNQYRAITLKETGRVGPLYYSYVVSMIIALVFAILGLLVKAKGP